VALDPETFQGAEGTESTSNQEQLGQLEQTLIYQIQQLQQLHDDKTRAIQAISNSFIKSRDQAEAKLTRCCPSTT